MESIGSLLRSHDGELLGAVEVGLILVNRKMLLMNAAAAVVIGTAQLGIPGVWVATAFYTVIAGSLVLVPILAYAIADQRVDHRLEQFKPAWNVTTPP